MIHLDGHYWGSGWRRPRPAVWDQRLTELLARPQWVMDGNYVASLATRLSRADMVILMDPPRWLCLLQIVLRIAGTIGRERRDLAPGCRERLSFAYLRWVWCYPRQTRPRVLDALHAAPHGQHQIVLRKRTRAEEVALRIQATRPARRGLERVERPAGTRDSRASEV